MKILSKEEIRTFLGKEKYVYDDEHLFNLSKLRKVYGKYVHPLTVSIAKRLVGQTFYALEGQDFWDAEIASDKMKRITKLGIIGFDDEDLQIRDFKMNSTYTAYVGESNHFCTGSGCDYIYVFLKSTKHASKTKSTMKSKSPKRMKKSRSKSPKKSKPSSPKTKSTSPKKERGCTNMSHIAKYRNRDSPPYPANECCGSIKVGNDGLLYISKRASNGVCRWIRY